MTASGPKVLHVFATFGKGGPQVRTASLLDRFPRGTRHFLCAMDGCTEALSLVPEGVEIHILPPPGERRFFKASRLMGALLGEVRPGLVLTYNWGAVETLAGAMASGFSKVVHHEEGFGPGETKRLFFRRNLARRLLFKGAAALAVPSKTLYRIARKKWKVPEEKLHYLPNGVDLERFRPAENQGRRPFRVGFLGAFREEKDLGLLVRAFGQARLPEDSLLLLAGTGPEEERIRQAVRNLGLEGRTRFEGAQGDPAPFYREIDLFALTSRTEQMPLVVLEAMASGLPLVATDVGDVREMVAEPNRAFLVPAGDAPGLARHMETLARDPELRRRIGRANRARCSRVYELSRALDAYMHLYLKVLGTSGRETS